MSGCDHCNAESMAECWGCEYWLDGDEDKAEEPQEIVTEDMKNRDFGGIQW